MSDTPKKPEQASELPLPPSANDYIMAAPRISVQAFCEVSDTAAAIKSASEDRRLGKAHVTVKMGGMAAAVETYDNAPTPPLAPITEMMRPTATVSEAENRLQIERTMSIGAIGPTT